jgi:pimeloyl-ACP methyl ester carboxylesterase
VIVGGNKFRRYHPEMAQVRAARTVDIALSGGRLLRGDLTETQPGAPVVVFAHGSGSSRSSPRNRAVAERLNVDGLGTLLLDLTTEVEEERHGHGDTAPPYDVDELANRLVAAVEWIDAQPHQPASVGYFAASTGVAGALVAAVRQGERISAVVSRAGRPDLAGDVLPLVSAPTLLIVGDQDPLLQKNKQAQALLVCQNQLEIMPGVAHLFEEPGALEGVAELAAGWFRRHLWRGAHP